MPIIAPCNAYTASDFFLPYVDGTGAATGDWGCAAATVDRRFCPLDRESNATIGPDYVGVFVRYRHDYITGFFGPQTMIESSAVIRIEPEDR